MQKKSSFIFSLDVIRVLAIAGVILIHTANAVYGRPDFFAGFSWWLAMWLNSISRIAIPLFILLSGYLLLNKEETFLNSLKRTLQRIFIPLLIWFFFNLVWTGSSFQMPSFWVQFIERLVTVNVFDLYFLVILLGLYILAPLLRVFLYHSPSSTQKQLFWFFLILGITEWFLQAAFKECSINNIFTYWMPYTGLFIGGYVLGNKAKEIKKITLLSSLYLLGVCVTVMMSYLTFWFLKQGNPSLSSFGCLSYYSDSYLSPNVVLMALCAFILLLRSDYTFFQKKYWVRFIIHSLARAAFAMYLLHTFLLSILDNQLHLFDHIAPAWLYLLIKWFTIFFLSYIFSFVFIRVPLIRLLFGEKK